jgi:hypothetical protein
MDLKINLILKIINLYYIKIKGKIYIYILIILILKFIKFI